MHSHAQAISLPGSDEFAIHDKSHVTPEIRKKPGISIGYNMGFHVPFIDYFPAPFNPNHGFHLAYNQLYVRNRIRYITSARKTTDEFQYGGGFAINLDFGSDGIYGSTHFFFHRPLLRFYFPLRIYLINEYGLGIGWRPSADPTKAAEFSPNFVFEPIRIKFFNSPFFLTGTTVYSMRNNVFGKTTLDVSVLVGLKLYMYGY